MNWLLFSTVAVLIVAPAAAQTPRMPVPLLASESYGPCSTAFVRGLEGTDGFLSVRAGPSRRERELARLRNGQHVYACFRDGDWFGIVFERGAAGACAELLRPRRSDGFYRGRCGSGWVHERYLAGYADFVSP